MATYREATAAGAAKLSAAGVGDAEYDARALMLHVTGMSLTEFLLRQDEELPAAGAEAAGAGRDAAAERSGAGKDAAAERSGAGKDAAAERSGAGEMKAAAGAGGVGEAYVNLIRRRARRVPLQHLTGVQWFYGLEFKVSGDVLIPRPETEVLVEEALSEIRRRMRERVLPGGGGGRLRVLDLCTGSGCVLISILHEIEEEQKTWPAASRVKIYAAGTDLSDAALKMAAENARRLGIAGGPADAAGAGTAAADTDTADVDKADADTVVTGSAGNITARGVSDAMPADAAGAGTARNMAEGGMVTSSVAWVKSDMFENVTGTFDVIVSNPPYIKEAEINALEPEVRDYDPRMALSGGKDGLSFYRILAEESRPYLKPGGVLLLEIGADQAEAVTRLLRKGGYRDITVRQDLSGRDRVVQARA